MPHYTTTTGLVINKKTIRDNDLLITLLTPELGKIVALAKGAKSIKSSRISSLQLGNTIKAHLFQNQNQYWISESQSLTSYLRYPKSLTQHNLLFYFLEYINLLIAENQQIDGIYQISSNIIQAIEKENVKNYIKNEIDLVKLLGFGVPPEIIEYYQKSEFHSCQKLLKTFLESIVEKRLESNKLFK